MSFIVFLFCRKVSESMAASKKPKTSHVAKYEAEFYFAFIHIFSLPVCIHFINAVCLHTVCFPSVCESVSVELLTLLDFLTFVTNLLKE